MLYQFIYKVKTVTVTQNIDARYAKAANVT